MGDVYSDPRVPNGRYTLGRLTEGVDRLGRDVDGVRKTVQDISTRLAAVEKHIENYPGRFVMSEGPLIKHFQDQDLWLTAVRAKSSVIVAGIVGIWTIGQIVAGYIISGWIARTFNLNMIHR